MLICCAFARNLVRTQIEGTLYEWEAGKMEWKKGKRMYNENFATRLYKTTKKNRRRAKESMNPRCKERVCLMLCVCMALQISGFSIPSPAISMEWLYTVGF